MKEAKDIDTSQALNNISSHWWKNTKNILSSPIFAPVLMGFIVFLSWDVAVDKYIVPRVEAKLLEENYLREDIKKGRFVTTDKEAFNSNHVIRAQQLIKLKNNELANLQSIRDVETKLVNITKVLNKFEIEKITPINQKIKEIFGSLSILEAQEAGKIKLKIYYHHDESKQGILEINKRNPAISSLIKNNDIYKLTSLNDNKERYRIRIQDLTVDGKPVTEAIANLYIKDHDELFDSSKSSGIGTAFIALN